MLQLFDTPVSREKPWSWEKNHEVDTLVLVTISRKRYTSRMHAAVIDCSREAILRYQKKHNQVNALVYWYGGVSRD